MSRWSSGKISPHLPLRRDTRKLYNLDPMTAENLDREALMRDPPQKLPEVGPGSRTEDPDEIEIAPGPKLLSVTTPVFNEEEAVTHCYEEVRRVMETLFDRYDYEHVFADNCSTTAPSNF